ncbi:O-antigen translocase [Pseudoalteromonas sp. S16_S37]|uniref:O-antigen translocase n=1 Tax=Pseudoalteromonas sp. S16_S37 TaxID=2720228 RepID=UPI00168022C4|nr:O-antigen translocase [Pseudoalteromonas sp. S16_S37]MBD1580957.1 O-antigen translocase [Pseudoalteromonas sp. S16_S37]
MKLFSVTILSGLLTLLNMVKGFVVSKFVAVYAGTEGVALVGQLQSFVNGLNGVMCNQLSQGVSRYTAEFRDNPTRYWRATTRLISFILVVMAPVIVLASSSLADLLFKSSALYWVILLVLFMLPLNIANALLLAVVNGREEHAKYITTLMISTVVSCLAAVLMIYTFGLIGGLAAVAINNAIAGIVVVSRVFKEPWFKLKNWFGASEKTDLKVMAKYLGLGLVGALTGPISLILVRDSLTSGISIDAAGQWQLVWNISTAYLSILITALGVYYYPKLSKSTSRVELKNTTLQVVLLVMCLAVLGGGIIYSLREFLILLLATDDFLPAEQLFKTQIIGDVIRILSHVGALLMLAKGYFKMNAFCEIFASFGFAFLTMYLIDIHGLVGVSEAYAMTYFTYGIIVWTVFYNHWKKMEP